MWQCGNRIRKDVTKERKGMEERIIRKGDELNGRGENEREGKGEI